MQTYSPARRGSLSAIFVAFVSFAALGAKVIPPDVRCAALLDAEVNNLEFLRSALDAMDAHVAILDATGKIIGVNGAWVRFGLENGSPPNAALGANYLSVCDSASPALPEAAQTAEWIRRSATGTNERLELIYQCLGAEGRVWFHTQGSSFEANGRRYLLLAHHDITQRMLLAEQVLALNRSQAVARIFSGFAHDMNNVLTVISGHASLARMMVEGTPLQQHLDPIEEHAQRAIAMVARMARASPSKAGLAPLIDVRTETLTALAALPMTPPNVTVESTFSASLGVVRMSLIDLHLVLSELVNNAVTAVKGQGGKVTVTWDQGYFTETKLPVGLAPSKNGYLRLVVGDTGPGISAANQLRLFEPFYRRKEDARTGFGLSIVHNVVTAAEGGILLESTPTEGTRVSVYLPAPTAPVAAALPFSEPKKEENAPSEGPWILVVDDNPDVLAVTTRLLQLMKFRVRGAGSVEEAKELFTDDIGLVLTDYAMPEGGGFAVAANVRALRPSVPVVVFSGEGEFLTAPDTVSAVVKKPFQTRELKALFDGLLAAAKET